MTQTFETTVLYSGTTGAQMKSVEQQLYNIEDSQPEGTRMALVLDINYPTTAIQSFASQTDANTYIAQLISTACRTKGLTPWAGETSYAFVTGPNQITIRWQKEIVGVIIVIVLLALLAVAVYEWIQGWRFEKGQFVNINTGQKQSPGTFFGTTLPNNLGSALQNSFNNLPVVLIGGGLVIYGLLSVANKGRGAVVNVFDPHGYRAEEASRARTAKRMANIQYKTTRRNQQRDDARDERKKRAADARAERRSAMKKGE